MRTDSACGNSCNAAPLTEVLWARGPTLTTDVEDTEEKPEEGQFEGKSRLDAKVGTNNAVLTLESFYSCFSSVSSASSAVRGVLNAVRQP